MSLDPIVVRKEMPIAVVILNRPRSLNALTVQLMKDLDDTLIDVERDDTVGALILTGAARPDGRPCFCAGADIKDMASKGSVTFYAKYGSAEEAYYRAFESFARGTDTIIDRGPISVFDRLANLSKPSIAAIDGICTAGGFELALACDIRVASETAQICDLHVKNIGHLGGAGVETRLTQLVGPAKAKELLWTGRVLDGAEATRLGITNQVCPPDQLLPKAKALAQEIASRRRDTIRLSKAVIDARMTMGERQSLRFLDLAAATLNLRASAQETNEGYKAFVEKRKPTFK